MTNFNPRVNALALTTIEQTCVYIGAIAAAINSGKFRLDSSGDSVPYARFDRIKAADNNSYFQIVLFVPCADNYESISGFDWDKTKVNTDNAAIPNAFLYSS